MRSFSIVQDVGMVSKDWRRDSSRDGWNIEILSSKSFAMWLGTLHHKEEGGGMLECDVNHPLERTPTHDGTGRRGRLDGPACVVERGGSNGGGGALISYDEENKASDMEGSCCVTGVCLGPPSSPPSEQHPDRRNFQWFTYYFYHFYFYDGSTARMAGAGRPEY